DPDQTLVPRDLVWNYSGAKNRTAAPPERRGRGDGAGKRAKKSCVQRTHFRLRTGWYIRRFGSDSVCFLDCPVFARAEIWFESHLLHSITPRRRGFWL